jgi:collagenase-like PrtC family protease
LSAKDDLKVELLAPARDLETGLAAINAGADAVYLGASQFGARESASNALETIDQLAQYAHRYWARVYVTVNTLLFDEEIPLAVKLIRQLYNLGVDAVIIQDAGLLECDLPPMPLFASTQMHNTTPARVKFLQDVGFKRVILARELSLAQIREIRAQTTLELESFIHGALCVCYSGQCAMSYALGGRSGNRGQCAQPCRKRYRLVDGAGATLVKDSYLLSLHDLNLSTYIPDLLDAGVSSFKIEGRLKDKAYVTNVVGYYRQQLEGILTGKGLRRSSSGVSELDFSPDPGKTFNRGYTSYFIKGRNSSPIGRNETPKWVGESIGQVLSTRRLAFQLHLPQAITPGDGLCFFDRDGELQGTTVNAVDGDWITPDKIDGIHPGLNLYRNHDQVFINRLEKFAGSRKINLTFKVSEQPENLVLTAEDEDGNQVSLPVKGPKIPAEKPELALATLIKQLKKTGGTGFNCQSVITDLERPFFIPVGDLNALRRDAIEALSKVRKSHRDLWIGKIQPNNVPFPEKNLTYFGNVLNQKAHEFYKRHGVETIQPAAESGLDLTGEKVMTTKYCIRDQIGACLKKNKDMRIKEPLDLIDEQGHRFRLRFNCGECEMEVILGLK